MLTGLPSPRTPLDYALRYYQAGWAVVPLHSVRKGRCTCPKGADCPSPGKHPRIPTWRAYQVQRPTAEEVRTWWSRWPKANVGVLTGSISGIICLDIDGPEGLEALTARGYALPPTAVSRTARGWHYIFRHPGGVVPNAVKLLPGVDLRADGGLFVAAPSVHASGRTYQWELTPDEAGIADPPAWLLEAIRQAAAQAKPHRLTAEDWSRDIPEGQRNTELTRRAGSLLAGGRMEPAEALTMLLAWNQAHCKPPLPEDEVRRIVASIARAEAAKSEDAKEAGEAPALTVETSEEFLAGADEPVPWLVEGLVAKGAATLLAAAPKAGKTTLVAAMLRAMLNGEPFLGLKTTAAKVLYLTEERRDTLRKRWQAVGLEPHPHLRVMRRQKNMAPLPKVMDFIVGEVEAGRVDLVVVDTIGAWWGVLKENEAGIVSVAVRELLRPAEAGAAVLLVHHRRKMGAEEPGEGVRGSSALAGAVDIVLELVRSRKAGAPPTVRELYGVGRYDEVPESLVYQLRGGSLVLLGSVDEWADGLIRERVIATLQAEPAGLTARELSERAKVNKGAVYRALDALLRDGWVVVSGSGRPGDPKRYVCSPTCPTSPRKGANPHHDGREKWDNNFRPTSVPLVPLSGTAGTTGTGGTTGTSGTTNRQNHSEAPSQRPLRESGTVGQHYPPPARPVYYPSATPDGRCGICGSDAWRPTADGRLLCARCHPAPVDLWETA